MTLEKSASETNKKQHLVYDPLNLHTPNARRAFTTPTRQPQAGAAPSQQQQPPKTNNKPLPRRVHHLPPLALSRSGDDETSSSSSGNDGDGHRGRSKLRRTTNKKFMSQTPKAMSATTKKDLSLSNKQHSRRSLSLDRAPRRGAAPPATTNSSSTNLVQDVYDRLGVNRDQLEQNNTKLVSRYEKACLEKQHQQGGRGGGRLNVKDAMANEKKQQKREEDNEQREAAEQARGRRLLKSKWPPVLSTEPEAEEGVSSSLSTPAPPIHSFNNITTSSTPRTYNTKQPPAVATSSSSSSPRNNKKKSPRIFRSSDEISSSQTTLRNYRNTAFNMFHHGSNSNNNKSTSTESSTSNNNNSSMGNISWKLPQKLEAKDTTETTETSESTINSPAPSPPQGHNDDDDDQNNDGGEDTDGGVSTNSVRARARSLFGQDSNGRILLLNPQSANNKEEDNKSHDDDQQVVGKTKTTSGTTTGTTTTTTTTATANKAASATRARPPQLEIFEQNEKDQGPFNDTKAANAPQFVKSPSKSGRMADAFLAAIGSQPSTPVAGCTDSNTKRISSTTAVPSSNCNKRIDTTTEDRQKIRPATIPPLSEIPSDDHLSANETVSILSCGSEENLTQRSTTTGPSTKNHHHSTLRSNNKSKNALWLDQSKAKLKSQATKNSEMEKIIDERVRTRMLELERRMEDQLRNEMQRMESKFMLRIKQMERTFQEFMEHSEI